MTNQRIPKSAGFDAFDVRKEVALRKLLEGRTVFMDQIADVDISNPSHEDVLFYNFDLDVWENHPLKTINSESLKGPGNIVISGGGGGTPAGTNTQVQFNSSGSFGADANFTYNTSTGYLLVGNGVYFVNAGVGDASFQPVEAGAYMGSEIASQYFSNNSFARARFFARDYTNPLDSDAYLEVSADTGNDTRRIGVRTNAVSSGEPYFHNNGTDYEIFHTGSFDPSTKQDTLVSGTNIRTVNGNTLLGSTDLVISTGATTLGALTDVTISSVSNGQVLTYDSGTSQWINATPSGGSGLTHWTESVNTSAPNATVPAVQFLATNAATSVDAVISSKGNGALLAQIPDNTTAGGNKRGTNSIDFQVLRTAATQVASGTRAAIVSGANNTNSSTNGCIAGGLTNTLSSAGGFIGGGQNNVLSASNAFCGAGLSNAITGTQAGVACGVSNQASGTRAFVGGGSENLANGESSWIGGGVQASTRGLFGAYAWSGARRAASYDNQVIGMTVQGSTSNATPAILTAQRGGAGSANVLVLPNNSCWDGEVRITGRSSTGGIVKRVVEVVGTRGANAGTTAIEEQSVKHTYTSTGLAGADAVLVANTTRGSLEVQVTGLAATPIDWFAHFVAGNQIVR